MTDRTQTQGIGAVVDSEGILRSALEKVVFFESRVSQLESGFGAARSTAQRPRANAAETRRFAHASREDCAIFGYGPDTTGATDIEDVQQGVLEQIRKAAALAADAAGA
jgi:hypothetical protein